MRRETLEDRGFGVWSSDILCVPVVGYGLNGKHCRVFCIEVTIYCPKK